MADYGLRIWDAAGNIILDVTDSLTRKVGEVVIPAGTTGSITVPATGRVWYYVAKNGSSLGNNSEYAPTLTVSGSTINWSPSAVQGYAAVDVTLVYGAW